MRNILIMLAALVGFAASARASVLTTIRNDWVSDDLTDTFHADQGGGGSWTETLNGAAAFHFVTRERTDGYVLIYDASRDLYVWLYPTAFYLKAPGDAAARIFRNGHWDDRRLYGYHLSDGSFNYLNLYPGNVWRWARASGVITNARETLRNNDQIQVYDDASHFAFSLMDKEVWGKFDGGAWFKLADGAWD